MTTLLSDLKGAQISIVAALLFALRNGRESLCNKELAEETGYNDNETIKGALTKLSRRGFVILTGKPSNRHEWALTAACRQMFLPSATQSLPPGPALLETADTTLPECPAPGGVRTEKPQSLASSSTVDQDPINLLTSTTTTIGKTAEKPQSLTPPQGGASPQQKAVAELLEAFDCWPSRAAKIAALPHVTLEFVAAHLYDGRKNDLKLILWRIENGEPPSRSALRRAAALCEPTTSILWKCPKCNETYESTDELEGEDLLCACGTTIERAGEETAVKIQSITEILLS